MAATAPSACRKGHLVAGVMPNTCMVAANHAQGQSLSKSFQAHSNGSNRTSCLPQGSPRCDDKHLHGCRNPCTRSISLKELPSTLEWQQPHLLLAARVPQGSPGCRCDAKHLHSCRNPCTRSISLKELPSTLEWQQPRLLLAARVTSLQV